MGASSSCLAPGRPPACARQAGAVLRSHVLRAAGRTVDKWREWEGRVRAPAPLPAFHGQPQVPESLKPKADRAPGSGSPRPHTPSGGWTEGGPCGRTLCRAWEEIPPCRPCKPGEGGRRGEMRQATAHTFFSYTSCHTMLAKKRCCMISLASSEPPPSLRRDTSGAATAWLRAQAPHRALLLLGSRGSREDGAGGTAWGWGARERGAGLRLMVLGRGMALPPWGLWTTPGHGPGSCTRRTSGRQGRVFLSRCERLQGPHRPWPRTSHISHQHGPEAGPLSLGRTGTGVGWPTSPCWLRAEGSPLLGVLFEQP